MPGQLARAYLVPRATPTWVRPDPSLRGACRGTSLSGGRWSRQSLSCVGDLRHFFLIPANYVHCKSLLVQRFGELLRKVAAPSPAPGVFLPRIAVSSRQRGPLNNQRSGRCGCTPALTSPSPEALYCARPASALPGGAGLRYIADSVARGWVQIWNDGAFKGQVSPHELFQVPAHPPPLSRAPAPFPFLDAEQSPRGTLDGRTSLRRRCRSRRGVACAQPLTVGVRGVW